MKHEDQHRDAIRPTVKVKNEVSAAFFDDKVREMGTVTVDSGKITIELQHLPSMSPDDARRDMILESINLALQHCWDAKKEAFKPDYT
jgi:hypothetical protein